jgi:hypothetical protein
VIARLQRATPYAAIPADNPLFTYEARRIRWGQSAWQLIGYSLAAWSLIPFLMAGMWLLLLADYPNLRVNLIRDQYFFLLLLCGVGGNFILDMVSITTALSSISSEMRAGRWDALRMTNLCPQQFIAAKHAAAEIRAWRVMALVVSLRLSLVAFLMIRVELLPSLFLLSGYCFVYILEPLCRMRALTAVGIAIAARMRNTACALLASSVVVLTTWIVQGSIILLVCGWLLVKYGVSSIPVLVCFQPLILVVLGWSFYTLCRKVECWSLRHATTHIFRQD